MTTEEAKQKKIKALSQEMDRVIANLRERLDKAGEMDEKRKQRDQE